ncbi:hypothetical protein TEU_04400 [Thermococcus eurythermalis]|uniref:Uncharacterized protein n=1 Tax=Thermococcus eurythermalis TaxID=1505907 RepID=A0A097QT51_9EURY|nr:hypothetical protein [Thermococcus eurythermalis]AIU69638.1 hypothetical protein TEU_04400 [Thermococcus eurythermalis]
MAGELMDMLKRKYNFLSIMLESVDRAMEELENGENPEEIYNTLVTFLGEFPTRRMLQGIADEKNMNIRVRTREDAIRVIKALM